MTFEFDLAQNELIRLNSLLKTKCPELELVLNTKSNLSNLYIESYTKSKNVVLLCLYYNTTCISNIEFIINETNNPYDLTINSKTLDSYQNKKYNKLLRCVAIYLSCFMTIDNEHFKTIISQGVNPITIWLMISYFNATYQNNSYNNNFIHYFKDKPIGITELEKYFELYDPNHYEGILLSVDITDSELGNKYMVLFEKIMHEISCLNGGGSKKRNKSKSKNKSSKVFLNSGDYKKILQFYNLSIPKSPKLLKKNAEDVISKKLCKCIKKIDTKYEAKSIGICTKTIINKKGYIRGKFTCKNPRTLVLKKKTRKYNKD